jgi:phosphatidylserine/phosphatidylglycerophosphate/cardiolipin synthase-like enzyme
MDIPKINKKLIKPFFNEVKKKELKESEEALFFSCRESKTFVSEPYSFDGAVQLKNLLKTAKKEIYLTSLYVTDDKIPWPDEPPKSWVDILSGIKLASKHDLKIHVVVKEPTTERHKQALNRLVKNGVNVYVFKKELEGMLPAIVHSKLIVIDPQIPENRHVVYTSSNFSPEMWKNHEVFQFSNDEECVKETLWTIKKILSESKNYVGHS